MAPYGRAERLRDRPAGAVSQLRDAGRLTPGGYACCCAARPPRKHPLARLVFACAWVGGQGRLWPAGWRRDALPIEASSPPVPIAGRLLQWRNRPRGRHHLSCMVTTAQLGASLVPNNPAGPGGGVGVSGMVRQHVIPLSSDSTASRGPCHRHRPSSAIRRNPFTRHRQRQGRFCLALAPSSRIELSSESKLAEASLTRRAADRRRAIWGWQCLLSCVLQRQCEPLPGDWLTALPPGQAATG